MPSTFPILDEEPECVCCPIRDVCTCEPGVAIYITKDMERRSGCYGGFVDAFDDIDGEVDY